jgi:hypothetical protein
MATFTYEGKYEIGQESRQSTGFFHEESSVAEFSVFVIKESKTGDIIADVGQSPARAILIWKALELAAFARFLP